MDGTDVPFDPHAGQVPAPLTHPDPGVEAGGMLAFDPASDGAMTGNADGSPYSGVGSSPPESSTSDGPPATMGDANFSPSEPVGITGNADGAPYSGEGSALGEPVTSSGDGPAPPEPADSAFSPSEAGGLSGNADGAPYSAQGDTGEPASRTSPLEDDGGFTPDEGAHSRGPRNDAEGGFSQADPQFMATYTALMEQLAQDPAATHRYFDHMDGRSDSDGHKPPDPARWYYGSSYVRGYFEGQMSRSPDVEAPSEPPTIGPDPGTGIPLERLVQEHELDPRIEAFIEELRAADPEEFQRLFGPVLREPPAPPEIVPVE